MTFARPARGTLHRQETIHWEDDDLASMFHGNVRPTDADGWTGFVDLHGRAGGPVVFFEFKGEGVEFKRGQEEAIHQLRCHLSAVGWLIVVRHTGTDHVYGRDITEWTAMPCGLAMVSRPASHEGHGVAALRQFVLNLDRRNAIARLPKGKR